MFPSYSSHREGERGSMLPRAVMQFAVGIYDSSLIFILYTDIFPIATQ